MTRSASGQDIGRNGQSDLFGGLEIDDELELRRLFHWEIRRLCAFQDLIDVSGGATKQIEIAGTIVHQSASVHELGAAYIVGNRFFAAKSTIRSRRALIAGVGLVTNAWAPSLFAASNARSKSSGARTGRD